MTQERRRDVRIRTVVNAQRMFRERTEVVEIVEASYRGLLMKCQTLPTLNELIKLRVVLREKIVILHVVPVRETVDRGAYAVGCKMFALGGVDKDAWHAFVTELLRAEARRAA